MFPPGRESHKADKVSPAALEQGQPLTSGPAAGVVFPSAPSQFSHCPNCLFKAGRFWPAMGFPRHLGLDLPPYPLGLNFKK